MVATWRNVAPASDDFDFGRCMRFLATTLAPSCSVFPGPGDVAEWCNEIIQQLSDDGSFASHPDVAVAHVRRTITIVLSQYPQFKRDLRYDIVKYVHLCGVVGRVKCSCTFAATMDIVRRMLDVVGCDRRMWARARFETNGFEVGEEDVFTRNVEITRLRRRWKCAVWDWHCFDTMRSRENAREAVCRTWSKIAEAVKGMALVHPFVTIVVEILDWERDEEYHTVVHTSMRACLRATR